MKSFNRIAWVYDFLKRIVFKKDLDKASEYFLSQISPNASVLVLGGGTGRLLQGLRTIRNVQYLESSSEMIRRARKNHSYPNVQFIEIDFLEYETDQRFDCIVCPFFLDVFTADDLLKVVRQLRNLLFSGGLLLVTDFQGRSKMQHIFIRLMYVFFKLTTHIQQTEILPIHDFLINEGFSEKETHFFRNELIFSRIYQLVGNH